MNPKLNYEVSVGETTRKISVQKLPSGRFEVCLEGEAPHQIDLIRPSPEALQLLIDGESWEVGCVPGPLENGGIVEWLVDVVGVNTHVRVEDPRRKALKIGAGSQSGLLSTSMPGRIVRLLVEAGASVKKGQPVIVVEAMKMENELKSPIDGVVAEVFVTAGNTVDAGAKLLRVGA
jgi:acetyl/propionyl-CoA carboxylase alpha subunit